MPVSNAPFRWRDIAVAAFGPSLLFSVGEGAILPVIALSARAAGASVALAGVVVSLVGIGSLISNVPAALLIERWGERTAMLWAAALSVAGLAFCLAPGRVWTLAVGVFLLGMATSVLLLARQTYLIEAAPPDLRARAMSALGGTRRIGVFVGPFIGAAAIHLAGLSGAYAVAMLAMLACGVLVYTLPELGQHADDGTHRHPTPRVRDVVREHRGSYFTLGIGALLVRGLRSCRQIVIPLWAAHLGIDPETTSVVYGVAALVDMLMFYPSGVIMDQYGRVWAAVPSMLITGIGMALEPATTGLYGFAVAAIAIGFGNGIGSGLVMTIAADVSPVRGRTQFLGVWRLFADVGGSVTPLLLSAIAGAASLAVGIVATGSLGFVAAAVFWRWLPRHHA